MPVKHGSGGGKARLADGFTPRQRCAIANPLVNGKADLHPRFYRRNGYQQSILTFDLFSDEGVPEALKERGVDGQVGVWHARVTQFPAKPLDKWKDGEFASARAIVRRLVVRVGMGVDEVTPGKDEASVHVFKWASISEVAQALRASEGRGKR